MEPGSPENAFDRLRSAAVDASAQAWCPYSQFRVGAALETVDGTIVAGCNVENASSGLTVCAERSAVCQAVARGHRAFRRIVIYTPTDQPTTPCGGCRQFLIEFGSDVEVVCVCDGPEIIRSAVSDLLPMSFGLDRPSPSPD